MARLLGTVALLAGLALGDEGPVAAYNRACVAARSGRREEAIEALRVAVERGFAFTATLLRDTDLDPIREHPAYASLLARVRENNARALAAFRPRAEKAKVLLYAPPDRSRPAPLVVALHPSGGTAATFAPLFRALARERGAALAVPQGVNPSGDGYDWGVVEQGGLLVELAVERARAAYAIDPARVVLAGYSNGASTAFVLALRNPRAYAGVLSIAGFYDERVAPVPSGTTLPRFAILTGALDPDSESNRAGAAALKANGGAVHLRVYESLGHALPSDRDRELGEALEFLLR